LERPPEIRSKASGGATPFTCSANQDSTPSRSIPSGTFATLACSLIAAKALIVDFGGVLTTRIWDSFSAFCTAEGLDPNAVKELFRGDAEALGLLRQLERGELTDEEFERNFGALLNVRNTDGLIDRLFAGLAPDEEMLDAVRAARTAGLRTGLISNSWGTGIYKRGDFDGLFDALVISGEVGLNKPEPEIFLLACERLGVEPGDCVFVDDLRENCAGAEAVGMTAVLHRDAGQTIAELEELLGVGLRASA
jgi:epoxide hydrolase-like predicted phosphatase